MVFITGFPGRCRPRVTVSLRAFIFLCLLAACNEHEPGLVHESRVNEWLFYTEQHGLASNAINTVFEDSKGDFWIGTNQGLSVLRDNQFLSYSILNGLLDNTVYAIGEDKDGAIWVGTRRGVNIFLDDEWLYVPFFYNAAVYGLLNMQGEQGMLIATGGYGTYRFDYETREFPRFDFVQDCDACNNINSLFQSKDGSVWVASSDGARRIRGNFITKFDQNDGLAGNIATTIAEDSWGNIWVGTVEGSSISKINGNAVSLINFNNGAEQNFIFGIQEDSDGNLWVGTVGNGLFHYDGAIMKQVYDGPPDNTITVLFKDSRGNLWVGTSQAGLAVYITNPIPRNS